VISLRSRRKLQSEQFNRACELRVVLDRFVQDFGDETRLHLNQATNAIEDWLRREYRLGMKAQQRRGPGKAR
jgi:hypothetical protein